EVGRYPEPQDAEVEKMASDVKQQRFKNDAEYQAALQQYGVTEQELKGHLRWQLTVLKFIDLRFRPAVQVSENEIEEYFRTQILPELRRTQPGQSVSLEEYRDKVEEKLVEARVDKDVDAWLKDSRQRNGVEYREEVFR